MDIEGVKVFVTTGLFRTFEIISLMLAGSYLLFRTDWQIGLIAFGFIVACEGALEEGNPCGPANSKIVINPSSPKINKFQWYFDHIYDI